MTRNYEYLFFFNNHRSDKISDIDSKLISNNILLYSFQQNYEVMTGLAYSKFSSKVTYFRIRSIA